MQFLFLLFAGECYAQSNCPGNVCPVPARDTSRVVLPDGSIVSRVVVRTAQVVAQPVQRHWTYPGDIYSHATKV